MDKTLNLIILGPQGSGKGTQAELLQKKLHSALFGAGDVLREIAKKDSELGRRVHQTINVEGRLVEPQLISEVMKEKISSVSKDQSLILDSYPRSLEQFEFFRKFWPQMQRGDYKVIYIELSEAEGIKRMGLRKRLDDTQEAIRKRLELFNSQTLPMIEKMDEGAQTIRINGDQSIEAVQGEILEKLNL